MSHTKRITTYSDKNKRRLFELDHVRWDEVHSISPLRVTPMSGQIINHPHGWQVFDGTSFTPLGKIHSQCEFFYSLDNKTPLLSTKDIEDLGRQFTKDGLDFAGILFHDEETGDYDLVDMALRPSPYEPEEKVLVLTRRKS